MSKVGRPLFDGKDEELILSKLTDAWAVGATDIEACANADISNAALQRYFDTHPEFRERRDRLKEKPVLLARTTVFEGLASDSRLAMDYLKNKKSDEFNTAQKIDQKTEISGNLDVTKLTDEELDELINKG